MPRASRRSLEALQKTDVVINNKLGGSERSAVVDETGRCELRINDVVLEAAIAIINAIAELVKTPTASQQEITREGRGSSLKTAFYKKNNRRVKATFMSKMQDHLDAASKAVGAACCALVRQVQDIISERNRDEGETVDYAKLSSQEFKVREMEQQVEILQLENSLARARQRLGGMPKISYQED
ncbi:hypothetical protein CNMCM5793_007673 [Aspergillus hiratsukae]|uniref:I/LWEQ domain-containing protein n=1 Tax=Aspergillus hiratsukae TaxID=1194566 RepID=A0A8H6V3Y6_9EURO|nr:hypothetical protein CNMCM5793_007673 [Aspergillus hiratsukae]KAF7174419.1 hypothetical protein CNMCM6106_008700 [Aspergillus hiratsukae]